MTQANVTFFSLSCTELFTTEGDDMESVHLDKADHNKYGHWKMAKKEKLKVYIKLLCKGEGHSLVSIRPTPGILATYVRVDVSKVLCPCKG